LNQWIVTVACGLLVTEAGGRVFEKKILINLQRCLNLILFLDWNKLANFPGGHHIPLLGSFYLPVKTYVSMVYNANVINIYYYMTVFVSYTISAQKLLFAG
jgi:hypothetical protein